MPLLNSPKTIKTCHYCILMKLTTEPFAEILAVGKEALGKKLFASLVEISLARHHREARGHLASARKGIKFAKACGRRVCTLAWTGDKQ